MRFSDNCLSKLSLDYTGGVQQLSMSASKIKRDANGALCIYSQDEGRCNSASVTYAIF